MSQEVDHPYVRYSDVMRDAHGGETLYRVPIDLGLGCPHRDEKGQGGCTFCPEDGSRANSIMGIQSIREQVLNGVEFARTRYRAKKFMAYFQAYTSTFAPVEKLKAIYADILALHPFDSLTIGTRPDCLPPSLLDYFSELNQKMDLWVELGIQTAHDSTLDLIHRGHDWATSAAALRKLNERNIKAIAHLIIGLPGENIQHFKKTIESLNQFKLAGIKIHNLHVIQNTELAASYIKAPFKVYSEQEYAEILLELLPLLPKDLPILRLTCDTGDENLIAPRWHLSKPQFLDHLVQLMRAQNIRQGDAHPSGMRRGRQPTQVYRARRHDDQSFTFFEGSVKEHYHSQAGATTEALHKYARPALAALRPRQDKVHLLDVCFGLGYNSLVSADVLHHLRPGLRLEITALEMNRNIVFHAARAHAEHSSAAWSRRMQQLWECGQDHGDGTSITMHWGDARHTLRKIPDQSVDIIFHDPFSTQRCAELWSLDFFAALKLKLKTSGVLLTYSSAGPVYAALHAAGFTIGRTHPDDRLLRGTIASLDARAIQHPLRPDEMQSILASTKGIPYRDPGLVSSNKEILRQRESAVLLFKARHGLASASA